MTERDEWGPWIKLALKSLLYFPQTGSFVWLPKNDSTQENKRWNTRYGGTIAFNSRTNRGYLCGRLDGKNVLAHRLVWAFETGAMPAHGIDHINGCITDNRFSNLRAATQKINAKNAKKRQDNTSGITGVVRSGQRWMARINVDGARIHLGTFDSIAAAKQARRKEQEKHPFSERHGL